MATVTLPPHYINPKPADTSFMFDNRSNNATADESFASYLNLMKKNFMPELGNSDPVHPSSVRITLGRKRTPNGELDIFDAEKYFSGVMDPDVDLGSERASNLSYKKEREASMKSQSKSASASTCSEASGNSQSTLLRDRRKHPASKGRKEANGRRFLGVFPCSCSGKNAAGVDSTRDAADETRLRDCPKISYAGRYQVCQISGGEAGGGRQRRESGRMTLTNSNLAGGKVAVGRETREEAIVVGAPMGVFGSPLVGKVDIASSFRKSLTMLTSNPRGGGDDDARSEASSDLFEIDGLLVNAHSLFRPDAAYEPSEASIEWSVATASAANFSVASEHAGRSDDHEANKWPKQRRPSLLMGCSSHKAVNVEKPERIANGIRQQDSVARYHAEGLQLQLMDFEPARARSALTTACSHSHFGSIQ